MASHRRCAVMLENVANDNNSTERRVVAGMEAKPEVMGKVEVGSARHQPCRCTPAHSMQPVPPARPRPFSIIPGMSRPPRNDLRLIGWLSVAQLISWGSVFYTFALLLAPVEHELGLSRAQSS